MAENMYTKLASIQQAIKVPKDQDNDFAGFKYRSVDDILEKLKPLLDKHKVIVILTDSLECWADQVYVKATARIYDMETETNTWLDSHGFAREEKSRPKMSEGQLTGTASSYARKYALNGLLLLDDGRDLDSFDNTKAKATATTKPPSVSKPLTGIATDKQRETIKQNLMDMGIALEDQKGYLIKQYGVEIPLTKEGASFVIENLFSSSAN